MDKNFEKLMEQCSALEIICANKVRVMRNSVTSIEDQKCQKCPVYINEYMCPKYIPFKHYENYNENEKV